MIPTLVGWGGINGKRLRRPDVLVTNAAGISPQYQDAARTAVKLNPQGKSMTGGQRKAATAAIIGDRENLTVAGCRNTRGDHRGASLTNEIDTTQTQCVWFEIAEGKKIPPGLAVIRDAPPGREGAVHYTVAPKDDMPLSLFLANLKSLLPDRAVPAEVGGM